jgi:acyl carrier protein
LDFRLLFPKRSRRVPLPTYPFARDRYWVEPVAPAAVESTMPVPDVVASVRHDEVIAPNETATRRLDVAPRADYVAPRTELERQLVEIWAEVLDLAPDAIGVNDGFFELGGHSVWAAEIILAIRDRLALELAPTAMFEAFTVAELAELLRDQSAEGRAAATLHEENAASQPASLVVSTST